MMQQHDAPSDASLLKVVASGRHGSPGSDEAFAALYERHQARVYRFALRLSGNRAVADEVTQEVFLLLLRPNHGYRIELGSLGAFLFGVARNVARRFLDRDACHATLTEQAEDAAGEGGFAAAPHDIVGALVRREQVEAVRRAVLTLPPDYREIVVLCDLEEMSYAEAAKALACPIGTVRSRLHRARSMLLAKLTAQLGVRSKNARCVR